MRHSSWKNDTPSVQVKTYACHVTDTQPQQDSQHKSYNSIHCVCPLEETASVDSVSFSFESCTQKESSRVSVEHPDLPVKPFGSKAGITRLHAVAEDELIGSESHDTATSLDARTPGQAGVSVFTMLQNAQRNKSLDTGQEESNGEADALEQIPANASHVAVCAGLVDFTGVSNVRGVVEWLEHLRLLDAGRVVLYHYNASKPVLAVLQFYGDQGFVNAIPWAFPLLESEW